MQQSAAQRAGARHVCALCVEAIRRTTLMELSKMRCLLVLLINCCCFVGPVQAYDQYSLQQVIQRQGCPGCDLTGANLTGFDLSNVNLSGANLSGAILTNVRLPPPHMRVGTNFSGAVWLDGRTICRRGSIGNCFR